MITPSGTLCCFSLQLLELEAYPVDLLRRALVALAIKLPLARESGDARSLMVPLSPIHTLTAYQLIGRLGLCHMQTPANS